MDTNNWRPTGQGGEPAMDAVDWRAQLPPGARQRIVNKIMETLKRHLPFSSQEGLEELKRIAMRFEEKIYTAATSQRDYLRKISLKMLTMESKYQTTMPNSLPPNPSGNINRLPDTRASNDVTQARSPITIDIDKVQSCGKVDSDSKPEHSWNDDDFDSQSRTETDDLNEAYTGGKKLMSFM